MRLIRVGQVIRDRIMSTALTTFLLIVLFSSQQLSTTAFSLVKCIWLGEGSYLFIDATVKCYQAWQIGVFVYLTIFVIPFWLSIFVGPGLLRHELIGLNTFLAGLLFPAPFLIYSFYLIRKHSRENAPSLCPNKTSSALLKEVWYSFKPFFNFHYFSWGGIVELRRLCLVICATLIATPIARITLMLGVILAAFMIHMKFNPYMDRTANFLCNISLLATVMVGIINFGWATIVYTESGFQSGDASVIGLGFVVMETALVQWLPVVMVIFCCLQFIVVNLFC